MISWFNQCLCFAARNPPASISLHILSVDGNRLLIYRRCTSQKEGGVWGCCFGIGTARVGPFLIAEGPWRPILDLVLPGSLVDFCEMRIVLSNGRYLEKLAFLTDIHISILPKMQALLVCLPRGMMILVFQVLSLRGLCP